MDSELPPPPPSPPPPPPPFAYSELVPIPVAQKTVMLLGVSGTALAARASSFVFL